jgi:glycosyltransferase involved in cell wall biosynthesis
MKICFANTLEQTGGAAIAAWRIFEEVHRQHPQSRYLVSQKCSSNRQVLAAYPTFNYLAPRLRKRLERQFTRLRSCGHKGVFSSARIPASTVVRKINSLNPDIVHLHWINNGLLAIEDLKKINAPLVWTLHDMWPFTGGCHYSAGCKHWLNQCGDCPQLTCNGSNDLSKSVFSRKLNAWKELNLTVVAPSQWLAKLAKTSPLLSRFRTQVIPNGLDVASFYPRGKENSRKSLSLPQHKSLALFGAMNATGDNRKGFDLLIESLSKLPESLHDQLELVVFGNQDKAMEKYLDFKIHFLGTVKGDEELGRLYSSADLFIAPSREDNLPNTCIEAMACGTPVVAFNIGGIPDIIQHKETGYLADALNTADMAQGIIWLLGALKESNRLQLAARTYAESSYNKENSAHRYIELYQEILDTPRK